MDTTAGTKTFGIIAMLIIAAVTGSYIIFQSPTGDDQRSDHIPVEFSAHWEPGDNRVQFFWLVGVRGEAPVVTGPSYTYKDVAPRGVRVELLVIPELPMDRLTCRISVGDQPPVSDEVSGVAPCQVVVTTL